MLIVLSPAKRLDWSEPPEPVQPTMPAFAGSALELAQVARQLDAAGIKRLMGISDKLAQLNQARFAAFSDTPDPDSLRPAAMAFAGDTYAGLEARSLDEDALRWAQGHLRILSGLYGLLRPLDAIQPYRLEMGSRLKTPRGSNLYEWWGDRLAKALNDLAAEQGTEVLVNCASQEYFGAVDLKALKPRVITPVFMEERAGKPPRVISFHAKKARGAMARFICENRLSDPEALLEFDAGGYRHAPELSAQDKPVFLRAPVTDD
ncbi:peroxide stress protein YaaA [Alkalilacustris brevis]|uniref:peroxide stress protein YaaA n=1 Tax=Alkalilacustris brevis TaxID=2026338 RepID=UPI000E0DD70A|nr:peroxide stress protein YaaA [Alkalilacustris brevis]